MSSHSKTPPAPGRRRFLGTITLLGGALFGGRTAIALMRAGDQQSADGKHIHEVFGLAAGKQLYGKPIGLVMAAVGKSFIGTPYAANTLEAAGEERLIVNLEGMDCVTFVENTLALSRCIRSQRENVDAFRRQLQLIRYRSGDIHGYPSRLHYFSDWILDNTAKKVVRDIAGELGGVVYDKEINFMSTHRTAYKQLADENALSEMKRVEGSLNSRKKYYLPKDKLKDVERRIADGDIIAITTSVQGLDVSHTGLALYTGSRLHFLHAPITGEAVQVSAKPFVEYMNASAKYTGVMIARPVEP